MAMASASRDAHATGGAAGTDQAAPAVVKIAVEDPHAGAAAANRREKFLPVTRHALLDRLTAADLWPDGDAVQARRFMRYLDYWRHHSYAAKLLVLEQTYEPFSPDSDLLQDALLQRGGARRHAEAAGGADGRPAAARQLHARRSGQCALHPDQGLRPTASTSRSTSMPSRRC